MELRDEAALLDARTQELLGRLMEGGGAARWTEASEAFGAIKTEMAAKDIKAVTAALARLDGVIAAGAADGGVWNDIERTIDRKRRLVATQTRRDVAAHLVMSHERAFALLGHVLATIRRHVTDRRQLALIAGDLDRVLGGTIVVDEARHLGGAATHRARTATHNHRPGAIDAAVQAARGAARQP
jgi:hypothetical protein